MKNVGIIMGINVTAKGWKSENEMIGIVSEGLDLYYAGKVDDFMHLFAFEISDIIIIISLVHRP